MDGNHAHSVLIVEDQPDLRALLVMLFEAEGFATYEVSDGNSAVELLKKLGYALDVVITDLGLPGLGGVDLISHMKARRPSIRVIGITGFPSADVRESVMMAGADIFIAKPFTAQDVLSRVKQLLELP